MNFSIKGALSAAIIFLSISCGNGNNQNNETAHDATSSIDMTDVAILKPVINNTDRVLAEQIEVIYNDYLQIQSALAGDQSSKASVAANNLNTLMDSFKDSTLPENQRLAYEAHITAIKESIKRRFSAVKTSNNNESRLNHYLHNYLIC